MKIGIDARPLSYRLTGIGIYLKHLLDEIQGLDTENHYCLISNAPIDYKIRNPKWSKVEGRFRTKLVSTLWLQLNAPLIASKKNIDLFWGPRHQLPVFLPQRVKTVLTVHDIVHRLYPETMSLPNLLSERVFFHLSLLRSNAIIVDSQSTASGIQRFYKIAPDKIDTIHPGIPFLPGKSNGNADLNLRLPSKYFLFVGTLDPRKNFERLFRAFEMIRPERHGVHLLIVGSEGWKNQSFRKRIKLHTLNGHVHMTGYVPRDCLESLYRKALCLVFPSLYEGFGFPILEAMFCGTPVITSNTSSMPEVAGNAALLVDPRKVNALVEAMHEVMRKEDLRNHLSAKGLERAKFFSWKHCAEETIQVFEKVLRR
jgi:glycosyltransferase involved in cell wall biosynthesis